MSQNIIFYLITGIYIFIGLQHLIIGLVSKEHKLNLYFGLFVLCMAGHEYANFLRVYGANLNDYIFATKLQVMFFQLGNIFNLSFISQYAQIRLKKMEYVIFFIIVFLLFLNFYLPYSFINADPIRFERVLNEYNEYVAKVNFNISHWILLWTPQLVLSNIYVFIVLGRRYKKRSDKTTFWLIVVCILVFLSIVNDHLVMAQLIDGVKIQHYAIFFLILVMTYIFLKHYAKTLGLAEKLRLQKQIMQNKEELTHMIVHDLKAPLNILLNLSTEQSKESIVEKIQNVSHKMHYQVQDIMDLYGSEQTNIKIKVGDFSLISLIENVYESVNYFIKIKDIEFAFESSYDYIVLADKYHIERVLVNLLSNAIKYTPQHGTVRIILTEKENKKIEIKVVDNGLGIAKEKIVNVFQKFEPINKPDNTVIQSTGLGLSYCKLAIDAHNSIINLESVEGQGTTVSFCLKFTRCTDRDSNSFILGNHVDNVFRLKRTEQHYLLQQYPELFDCQINEITKLRKIVRTMETDDVINKFWLENLRKSIMSFDETLFDMTISAVSNKKP